MLLFLKFLKSKKEMAEPKKVKDASPKSEKLSARKGELGEYKIDLQLDQLPKDCSYLSDLLVENPKAKSGYSQIDHVVLTPYGIIVIETKNYQGTIYGGKDRNTWSVNGKFKMMNPFFQNYGHIQALKSLIDEKYHELFVSMVSFTKRCTFKVDMDYRKIASNELIVYDIELSEFIHRKVSVMKIHHKEPLLDGQDISEICNAFSDANIIDSKIRDEHVQAFKAEKKPEVESGPPSTCTICNKPVSDKVRAFCLASKKFNCKIYCYEHQKTAK